MPRILTSGEWARHGFDIRVRHMEEGNGEFRAGITLGDKYGPGVVITTVPMTGVDGGWQEAHVHRLMWEFYTVYRGWIASARLVAPGKLKVQIFHPGDHFFTTPNEPHNVYVPLGATFLTAKCGQGLGEKDWFASEELDALTKPLSEVDIQRLAVE